MRWQKDRFRFVCRWLLSNGIKPTPTMLEKFEQSFVWRTGRTNIALSHGRLTAIRREEFTWAGWRLDTDKGYNGTWMPPKKPNVGDIIKVGLYIEDMRFPDVPMDVKVLCVFDNLDESWDPWGEMAWAQADIDELVGRSGIWYAVFEAIDGSEIGSAASYELAS